MVVLATAAPSRRRSTSSSTGWGVAYLFSSLVGSFSSSFLLRPHSLPSFLISCLLCSTVSFYCYLRSPTRPNCFFLASNSLAFSFSPSRTFSFSLDRALATLSRYPISPTLCSSLSLSLRSSAKTSIRLSPVVAPWYTDPTRPSR